MQNSDFYMNAALNKRLNFGDDLTLQNSAPELQKPLNKLVAGETASTGSTGFGSSLGTPEMMAIGTGLQVLGQYLDAPYKEMAAKQSMEERRRDKQDAALRNLQNISQLYGRL